MGLRQSGTSVVLNTMKGSLLALRYLDDQSITSTPPWNGGNEITQNVPRAEVVEVIKNKDGSYTARLVGRTLVFQRAIANDIRGSSDWAFGLFDEFDRPTPEAPDATMYELAVADDVDLDKVEEAFAAAGIQL
jgi:hypothetical protein